MTAPAARRAAPTSCGTGSPRRAASTASTPTLDVARANESLGVVAGRAAAPRQPACSLPRSAAAAQRSVWIRDLLAQDVLGPLGTRADRDHRDPGAPRRARRAAQAVERIRAGRVRRPRRPRRPAPGRVRRPAARRGRPTPSWSRRRPRCIAALVVDACATARPAPAAADAAPSPARRAARLRHLAARATAPYANRRVRQLSRRVEELEREVQAVASAAPARRRPPGRRHRAAARPRAAGRRRHRDGAARLPPRSRCEAAARPAQGRRPTRPLPTHRLVVDGSAASRSRSTENAGLEVPLERAGRPARGEPGAAARGRRRRRPAERAMTLSPTRHGGHRHIELSVVIPCYNEEDSLPHAGRGARRPSCRRSPRSFEVILVDDGSRDRTLPMLREISPARPGVPLPRAEPQLRQGVGDARRPQPRPRRQGRDHGRRPPAPADSCWRRCCRCSTATCSRSWPVVPGTSDPPLRTFLSKAYYRLINRLIDVELEDGVGDFRVLDRDGRQRAAHPGGDQPVLQGSLRVDRLRHRGRRLPERLARGRHHEVAALRPLQLRHRRRRVVQLPAAAAVDLVRRPGHRGRRPSTPLWVLGSAIVNGNSVPGYVTTICAVTGFGGVQLILLGVIGEYLGRIYAEVKRRPLFLLKESSARVPTVGDDRARPRARGPAGRPRRSWRTSEGTASRPRRGWCGRVVVVVATAVFGSHPQARDAAGSTSAATPPCSSRRRGTTSAS